jgi:hypothetical protein
MSSWTGEGQGFGTEAALSKAVEALGPKLEAFYLSFGELAEPRLARESTIAGSRRVL